MSAQTQTQATKHTCGGPKFGRLTDGCPRCAELKAGAEPRSWGHSHLHYFESHKAPHNCKTMHCGPVCTYGD